MAGRPGAARRRGRLAAQLWRGAAAGALGRRPHSRRVRDRPGGRLRARRQARVRRLPRPAAAQRRLWRHAVPGHPDPAARGAGASQCRRLRPQLPHHRYPARVAAGRSVPRAVARQGQQHPPSGHQGPRARLRGGGGEQRGRPDRGDPPQGRGQAVPGGCAMAPGIPPSPFRHHRRRGPARGLPRRRADRQEGHHSAMSMLAIHNPSDGEKIATIAADDASSVADKAAAARAAQPAWAARPLAERRACIERFRGGVLRELESLAMTMTRETGKPIRMSRNELNGLLGRIDFFVGMVEPVTAIETVYDEGGMQERIEHVPLGVVGNISAWNYPWFVGCNVILPALLTGNAVLYKPSEFATLTGLEIARLLHEAGVPRDVFAALVGAGPVGAALLEQRIDGLFFTGSHATGTRIAQTVGSRFIKLQLELGGKDPTYVCDDADPKAAAQSLADGAMYNTGQSCCSVERIYVHVKVHDAFLAE